MSGTVAFAGLWQHPSVSDFSLGEEQRTAACGLNTYYDALVFGKGPAACIFAIQMARRGKAVLMVPPSTESSLKPWGETLAPRGEFLLTQLGLVNECLTGQHSTQAVLSCWRSSDPERTDLAFDPHGRMWHINRPAFDKALQNRTVGSGVDILNKSVHRVAGFTRGADFWEVRLVSSDSERVIKAAHIVDATGRSSCIARAIGSRRILRDHLVALSCAMEKASGVEPLLIEPVSGGWWYSLGLSHEKLLVVLMTDPKLFKLSAEARKSLWTAMLDEAPHTRKRIEVCEQAPGVASAGSSRLDSMSGEGWLAIGDAAMSFDPLSSHGLTSAIEQAIDAAERLSGDGHAAALIEFEEMRKGLFGKYRTQRRAFYQTVRRFSGQAFWQNRMLH
jgi:flavin-dependent dehydrogenase